VKLVGICGYAGSGKSTLAEQLAIRYGYVRTSFATPLKEMLYTLCPRTDMDRKDVPTSYLCGKTPREALQFLGTEWGRYMIGEDLWVDQWQHRIGHQRSDGAWEWGYHKVVVDDVRFPNELNRIHSLGGSIVLVEGTNRKSDHSSENVPLHGWEHPDHYAHRFAITVVENTFDTPAQLMLYALAAGLVP